MKKHSQETDKVEGTQNMTSNSMSRPDIKTPYANDLIEMEIKKAKKQAYAEIFKELENGLYRIRSGREIFLTDFAHYNNIKKKYMGGKN